MREGWGPYRVLIPNGITLTSLLAGTLSILVATSGRVGLAGLFIVMSCILDILDGEAARRLKAGSAFGLQLDSLVDMVSLGVAPAVLAFVHLQSRDVPMIWVWPAVALFPPAGAFRLARFNLQPPKTSGKADTTGLPISTSGVTVTLAVLFDLQPASRFFVHSGHILVILLFALSFFMVSRIPFPSISAILSGRKRQVLLIGTFLATLFLLPRFLVWLAWTAIYLVGTVARAARNNRWRTTQGPPGRS